MSKAQAVPSSSKQPIFSGSYFIHKSTQCRVSQVVFVSPSCSPWLVHLKMGDGAVMAKQCQILSTLTCHQSKLIFLQSYEDAQQRKHILTGFSSCQWPTLPRWTCTIQPLHLLPLSVKFKTECLQGLIKQLLEFLPSQHWLKGSV